VVTLDPLLEQRQSMGNFGLGVLGAVGGSLLGGGLYYVLFIHTGFRVKLVALAVGVLAALGAKLLSKDRSKELGGIVALLAIASIVGAQYLVAQQWFKAEDTTAPQKSNYEERVGEARKVLEAVPNGTDQEIRLYLAKEQAEDGEKPDPKSIGRDEIKDFRENGLPHYRDLANGKISKEEFDKENDVTLSAEDRQKEQKENERTFQWVFLALTLSKFNIVCLIGAAGIAYRMTADA
jgi:cytoskeletal protein RodZ